MRASVKGGGELQHARHPTARSYVKRQMYGGTSESEGIREKYFLGGFQRIKVTITKHIVKSAMQQKNIDL